MTSAYDEMSYMTTSCCYRVVCVLNCLFQTWSNVSFFLYL